MNLNTNLMDDLYGFLILHGNLHNQDVWNMNAVQAGDTRDLIITNDNFCGTTACLAGWCAILTAPMNAIVGNEHVHMPDMRPVEISEYARQKMGLTQGQATWLFWDTTRPMVLWALKWLKDHPDAGYDELMDGWDAEQVPPRRERSR